MTLAVVVVVTLVRGVQVETVYGLFPSEDAAHAWAAERLPADALWVTRPLSTPPRFAGQWVPHL